MSKITDRSREHNKRRSEAIQRFVARYDARTRLRAQADDWAEGFSANTDMTHTIGGTSGDRISAVVVGPYPSTDPEDEGKVELIEGHGLAQRCAAQADWLDQWLRDGDRSDNETFALLPADHPLAEMRARHANPRNTGAGICDRCGHNAIGIRESAAFNITADRIKNGYCFGPAGNDCYNTWISASRPNREAFIKTWQPEGGLEETADDTTRLRDSGTTTARSGEVRPGGEGDTAA